MSAHASNGTHGNGVEPGRASFRRDAASAILEVRNLKKSFPVGRRPGESAKDACPSVKAVDGVSFTLARGEILGLVGESGCGKTTMGKLIMKLLNPTSGRITVDGQDVTAIKGSEEIGYRRKVQMVFQDPYASMNPRYKVRDVLEEPLLIHGIGRRRAERMEMIAEVMRKVKMTPAEEFMDRYPHMLSGGQRQRIATARMLILSPKVIVADEPVSMIDLSTRAEILSMMQTVRREMELSFLYITHDISTARYFTDRIAVMYLGRIVEIGTADDVIDNALHPYTKALIMAVCEPVPGRSLSCMDLPIKGEIPDGSRIPQGCRFHPRCPYATGDCVHLPEPELEDASGGHMAACRRCKET